MNRAEQDAATFAALVGIMIAGALAISPRNLRRIVGVTGQELRDSVDRLAGRGWLQTARVGGASRAVAYELTAGGRRVLAGLPPVRDPSIPEAFRVFDYADTGRLWALAPRGIPLDTKEIAAVLPDADPNSVYRWARKLAALPVPVVTITRDAEGQRWIHAFHDLEPDELAEVAAHVGTA